MANKVRIPFDEGAKVRHVPNKLLSETLDGYVSGGTSNMPLRKVGLTMGLLVQLRMDVVVASGTPLFREEGLYDLIKRIQVIIGNNQAQPIDLDGASLKHVQRTLGFTGFGGFDVAANGKIAQNPTLYAGSLTGGGATNKWVFTFFVPFSVNFHADRHMGILPTAARGFTANLQIDWNKIEDVITGGTVTITNSMAEVEGLTLDVPDFNEVEPPKFWVFARKSVKFGSVQPGLNRKELPQGGILHSVGMIVKANGVRTSAINEVGIVYDGNDQPSSMKPWVNHAKFAAFHRQDLSTGEVVYNLLEGTNETFSGSMRDTIDTTKVGLLEVFVDLDASADLSSNSAKNSITVIRTSQHEIKVNVGALQRA